MKKSRRGSSFIRMARSYIRCGLFITTVSWVMLCGSAEADRRDKTPALKKSQSKSRSVFGFVYGEFMSADVTFESKSSPSSRFVSNEDFGQGFGLFLDFPVRGNLWLSVAADIIDLPVSIANNDAMNLSLLAKYNILSRSKKAALRPNFGFGFAYSDKVLPAGGSISETTVRYGIEGVAFPVKGIGVVGQFGWWRGVSGGSSTTKVRVGALPFVRVGLAFGRFAI